MRAPVDVLTKVACMLFYLSDDGRIWKTAIAFGLSQQDVSGIIQQFSKAITICLGSDYIKTLSTEPQVKDLVVNFYQAHCMPQCLGAIDWPHIELQQPLGHRLNQQKGSIL